MKPCLAICIAILAAPVASSQSMPGMTMPPAPRPQPAHPHHPAPASDTAQPPKAMEGMPMEGPSLQTPPAASMTHDTLSLQEPEDPLRKTGGSLPAPDLLRDAATRKALSLDELLRLAEANNPTLAQARALVARSAAQARQAALYPNPEVGYQGEQIRGGQYGGGEQGGYIQQTIVLGGKLGLRRGIYESQRQADLTGVEEQAIRVHSDVAQAFYNALTAQAMVVVHQRMVALAQDAVETVHQLANVGQADAPDILQAEVEAEQTKVEFVGAQRRFLAQFRLLTALCGAPSLPVSPLAGALEDTPTLDPEQQLEFLIASSPAVRRMQQQVTVQEARLKDARREWIPDLKLKAGVQYNLQHISEPSAKATGPQSFASAGIDLPLWNRSQGGVAAAQAELDRARQEILRQQLELRHTAEPIAQSYLEARFTADRYRTEMIPRAQRAYELYLDKYQKMATAYPQVLVSQRTLFQLQIGYLTALQKLWSSALSLQNFTLAGALDARSAGAPE